MRLTVSESVEEPFGHRSLHCSEKTAYDMVKQSYGEIYELFYFITAAELLRR